MHAFDEAMQETSCGDCAEQACGDADNDHREALTEIIDAEFRKHPNRYWLDKLGGALPIAPVLDLAQALDNPFLHATEMIRDLPNPLRPGLRALANPLKINGSRLDQVACSQMGEDNAELLGSVDADTGKGAR